MPIGDSNWTEWSKIIQGAQKLRIVRHEVQLLINCNYNKIREDYDSGINYFRG